MSKIIHISSVAPKLTNGMGRVSYYWKLALERAGHEFIHIGPEVLKNKYHPLLLGWYLRQYIRKKNIKGDLVLVHEPLSGFFSFIGMPIICFSHGIEERAWISLFNKTKKSIKTKLIPKEVRFLSNNIGFKMSKEILILNTTDRLFLAERKKISYDKIHIIKNGYYAYEKLEPANDIRKIHFLFNSSWIERKGINLLTNAFNKILHKNPTILLTIAGVPKEVIYSSFDKEVTNQIKIVETFSLENEKELYKETTIFVMPSYFEGQSLALTQAMSMGLCPIVSDNSGQIDFINHEKNGLVFKTGDIIDFIEKIESLIEKPEKILKYGKEAKQSVEHLKWDNVNNELVSLIEKVINQNTTVSIR